MPGWHVRVPGHLRDQVGSHVFVTRDMRLHCSRPVLLLHKPLLFSSCLAAEWWQPLCREVLEVRHANVGQPGVLLGIAS